MTGAAEKDLKSCILIFLAVTQILPYFWTSEPCDWTIANYVSRLIAQDSAIARSCASNRLINDTTIVKNHAIVGTIAETMANTMASSLQSSRRKETFKAFFVNHADQMSQETLEYGTQKTRLRSAMAEQVANEEEKENARKRPIDGNHDCQEDPSRRTRKVFTVIDDNQTNQQGDDDDHNDNGDDKKDSIWEEWKQLLDDQENEKCFMQLSPERHKAIWCGKLVRKRNCLPPELYNKLNQEIPLVTMQDINPCFAENSIAIFNAVCCYWNSNKNIKPFYDQRTRNHKNFAVGLISMIIRLKEGKHASIVAERSPISVPSSPMQN